MTRAEDLAQETLAAVLSRDDYEFEKEEDFLRVCYGFAGRVSQAAHRESNRSSGDALPLEAIGRLSAQSLKDAELLVYLNEVLRLGREQLREADWQLIERSAVADGGQRAGSAQENKARVRLHRARRKLAALAGWREG